MGAIEKAFHSLGDAFGTLGAFIAVQVTNFAWTDVVDIVLLALFLFVAFRFLQVRRSTHLAVGILLWFVSLALSRVFRLHAVYTLLKYTFQAGIVGLIVLFQPELRESFSKLGGKNSYKNFAHNGEEGPEFTDENIDFICEAVDDMARSKTGALIVIERTLPLNEAVLSGIELDAKISPYLLRNIFFDKSPLHDGAVIIRNMRICSAGCLLQLTRRSDVNPDLGTRHRAAIGMSEVSDAVAIVVSEETGIISVAYQRELTRNYSYQSLRTLLYQLLPVNGEPMASAAAQTGNVFPADKVAEANEANVEEESK